MKNNKRITRINEEVKREISIIIQQEIKDPRLAVMISVVNVDVTSDLKFAKIYVSTFCSKEEKEKVSEALKKASPYIKREIAKRINLRITPELIFILDDSIEYGAKMSKLIDDVNKN